MTAKINIHDVNLLPGHKFESIFGNVVELCPAAAVQVNKSRPFANLSNLHDAFNKYLQDLRVEDKMKILQFHPDLAGRLAASKTLTKESTNEQCSAGLHNLTSLQKNIIDKCNESYKIKFGFPFIICVRENKLESIMDGLKRRNCNSKEHEITTALEEVKKYAS